MTKFKAKIWNHGNSHVITIPSDFIKHGILKEGLVYDVQIKEVKNDTNQHKTRSNSSGSNISLDTIAESDTKIAESNA